MTKIHHNNAISKLMRDYEDFTGNKVVRKKLNQISIEEAIRNADPLSFVKISDDFFLFPRSTKNNILAST